MSEKRRDNKNRVLRGGESQRKDGRYMYKLSLIHIQMCIRDSIGGYRYENWKK